MDDCPTVPGKIKRLPTLIHYEISFVEVTMISTKKPQQLSRTETRSPTFNSKLREYLMVCGNMSSSVWAVHSTVPLWLVAYRATRHALKLAS